MVISYYTIVGEKEKYVMGYIGDYSMGLINTIYERNPQEAAVYGYDFKPFTSKKNSLLAKSI